MTANNSRLVALLSAILAAAVLRLVPHPPNFTPIGAMALFSAAYLGRRVLAFAVPLILCALNVIPFRYATWILVVLLVFFGWRLLKSKKFMPAGLMVILTVLALALPRIL